MILRLFFLFALLSITYCISLQTRYKRDFMYMADENSTDSDCFQQCNDKYRHDFEFSFNMSSADFYDFPFHPLVLDHSTYLLYCKLAEQRTICYQQQCADLMADTVFSPSNFMCNFKRAQFTEVRPCLAEAEPITFLKCDQTCQNQIEKKKKTVETDPNQVFTSDDLDNYESELDVLCSFQSCYMKCMESIVMEVCSRALAGRAVSLVRTLVEWHAADIVDWHTVTGRDGELPASCRQLDTRQADPILQIISRTMRL